MKIAVASKNPVKLNAVALGFQKMFPGDVFEILGVSVESGVSAQPMSDAETLRGAMNRANGAMIADPSLDFAVGLEGGVEDGEFGLAAFAWAVVKSKTGKIGRGKTGVFYLPGRVAELVRGGVELGEADDIVFERSNSKEQNGAVGILTNDVIDRTKYYTDAVIFALIPHKNETLYNAE